MIPENKVITKSGKKECQKLLDELETKKPEELPDWNIRARTLLIFIAMRNPLEAVDTGVPIKKQQAGQLALFK